MQWAQAAWTWALGVLLMLLGLLLLASPRISYSTSEEIAHTRFSVKRQKIVVVPRAVAVLITCSGVVVLFLAGRNKRQ